MCCENLIQPRHGRVRTAHWSNSFPPPHLFRQEIHQLFFSDLSTSSFILLLPLLAPLWSHLSLISLLLWLTYANGCGENVKGNATSRYTCRVLIQQHVMIYSVFTRVMMSFCCICLSSLLITYIPHSAFQEPRIRHYGHLFGWAKLTYFHTGHNIFGGYLFIHHKPLLMATVMNILFVQIML